MIYNIKDNDFSIKKGPVFANFVLADEINRAPAKVQSALLEVMQEKQVTIGDETMKLPKPFLVLATQNRSIRKVLILLPEAQSDRFMLKCTIDYPKFEDERTGDENGFNFASADCETCDLPSGYCRCQRADQSDLSG
jgi:MoxR-like ATPase